MTDAHLDGIKQPPQTTKAWKSGFYFLFFINYHMKNYKFLWIYNWFIRELNNRLKKNKFFIKLPFGDAGEIQKIEFDSENKVFWNWVNNIWAFYLIYNTKHTNGVSEWIVYWINKTEWLEKIYKSFETAKEIWCNTISL